MSVRAEVSPLEDGAALRLSGPDGIVGWGEAMATAGRAGPDAAALRAVLADAAPLLSDYDPDSDEPATFLAEAFAARVPAVPALFAIECALFDLHGQAHARPVHRLLVPDEEPSPIPSNGLVATDTRALPSPEHARRLVAAGFTTLKAKIGRAPFEAEAAALAALRAAVGPLIRIRVDVNGAWTSSEAPERIAALAALDLEYVEQPVPAADLPRLPSSSAVPLAADESLEEEGSREAILAAANCAVLVLKPARIGLLRALSLAGRASGAGMDVVVTHAGDGAVGLAAAAELALALSGRIGPRLRACGLAPHARLAHGLPLAPVRVRPTEVLPGERAGLALDPRGERA